jgi:hypothetical protein
LTRLERALARIEAAAGRPPVAGPAGDPALAEAHRALRSRVEEAIGQIDRLLDGAEAG